MKSLNSLARRTGAVATIALSAIALAACSAGQISQTANKVPAVDGAHAGDIETGVAVLDATVLVDEDSGDAALKFTAADQDSTDKEYELKSITVDGQSVDFDKVSPLSEGCRIVGDSADNLALINQDEKASCTEYTKTSIKGGNFEYGKNVPVEFTFSNTEPITLDATVAAPTLKSGSNGRDYTK